MAADAAYRQVVDALRAFILSGELPRESQLPSLNELAATYGVSHGAARLAVRALRDEGLVVTRAGSGAYVRGIARIPRKSPQRTARAQWGSGKAIQDLDTSPRPRSVGVEFGEMPAPAFVAEGLGLAVGATVVFRSRRFETDGQPVQLSVSYVPADVARGTALGTQESTGPGGMYARLAEVGFAPVSFTEVVTARPPYGEERERLRLTAPGFLVFEIVRRAFVDSGRCVEVNRMILDASVYNLVYEFPA